MKNRSGESTLKSELLSEYVTRTAFLRSIAIILHLVRCGLYNCLCGLWACSLHDDICVSVCVCHSVIPILSHLCAVFSTLSDLRWFFASTDTSTLRVHDAFFMLAPSPVTAIFSSFRFLFSATFYFDCRFGPASTGFFFCGYYYFIVVCFGRGVEAIVVKRICGIQVWLGCFTIPMTWWLVCYSSDWKFFLLCWWWIENIVIISMLMGCIVMHN